MKTCLKCEAGNARIEFDLSFRWFMIPRVLSHSWMLADILRAALGRR
jgi:hypothetical protein